MANGPTTRKRLTMARLTRKQTAAIFAGTVGLVAAGGTGAAIAVGGDDDATDHPIEGQALQKAEQAALDETGGGTVTETEVGDEESYYEVEVTLDDGSQVDVQLDRDFQVVGSEADGESESGD
jgi:uncharacterized membrane protein YkoI